MALSCIHLQKQLRGIKDEELTLIIASGLDGSSFSMINVGSGSCIPYFALNDVVWKFFELT